MDEASQSDLKGRFEKMVAVCLIFAFVLFVIGAFSWFRQQNPPYTWFPHVVSLGLAFWVLAQLWPMISR
jgi:hypothetical protein